MKPMKKGQVIQVTGKVSYNELTDLFIDLAEV